MLSDSFAWPWLLVCREDLADDAETWTAENLLNFLAVTQQIPDMTLEKCKEMIEQFERQVGGKGNELSLQGQCNSLVLLFFFFFFFLYVCVCMRARGKMFIGTGMLKT